MRLYPGAVRDATECPGRCLMAPGAMGFLPAPEAGWSTANLVPFSLKHPNQPLWIME